MTVMAPVCVRTRHPYPRTRQGGTSQCPMLHVLVVAQHAQLQGFHLIGMTTATKFLVSKTQDYSPDVPLVALRTIASTAAQARSLATIGQANGPTLPGVCE